MVQDIKILLGSVVVCFILACIAVPFWPEASQQDLKYTGESISAERLSLDLAAGKEMLILDVRASLLYDIGHISGAVHFPESDWNGPRLANFTRDRSRWVVVYCSDASCDDSKKVAQLLIEKGLNNVSVLTTGWTGWTAYQQQVLQKPQKKSE
jgi:rhodanese-related sulfurtransferase